MAQNNHTVYLDVNAVDINSQDIYWICVSVPYKYPDTFDRRRLAKYALGELDVSLQEALGTPADSERIMVFGDDDITSWTISYSKSSFTYSFQANLTSNGDVNYLQEVMPGDYMFFWAFEDRESYDRVLGSLYAQFNCVPDRGGKAAGARYDLNAWDSGLKFMGCVEGVRQYENVNAQGKMDVGFTLSAHGCTEFGNRVHYDGAVRFNFRNAVQFMGSLGLDAASFLSKPGTGKGVTVNTSLAIPFLAYLYLGRGPTDINVDPSGISVRGASGIKDTPNRALEVPKAVLKIMGADGAGSKGVFSDLIQFFVGVETYNNPVTQDPWSAVVPDLQEADSNFGGLFLSGTPLDDQFVPTPLDFKNTTVWELMGTYLNPPMNEMYVTWKPNAAGRIYPTLVCRRLPLVSDDYINASDQGAYPTTAFSKLPRWIVSPRIVKSADIGRSNAGRVNAVYINGSTKLTDQTASNDKFNRTTAPPAYNGADIYRCGLRPFFATVPAFTESILKKSDSNPGRFFTAMMADVVMDQHLRFSGSITMVGRQEPIVPGDNLVHNGILFHIEQIQHMGRITALGGKTFDTSVWVTNGLPLAVLDPRAQEQQDKDAGTDALTEITAILRSGGDVDQEKYERLLEEMKRQGALADLDGFRLLTKRNERQDLAQTATSIAGITTFTRNE